jgi:hypothetical protein
MHPWLVKEYIFERFLRRGMMLADLKKEMGEMGNRLEELRVSL